MTLLLLCWFCLGIPFPLQMWYPCIRFHQNAYEWCWLCVCGLMITLIIIFRDHFVCVPSQWESTLQCNVDYHWLGAHTKWSLILMPQQNGWYFADNIFKCIFLKENVLYFSFKFYWIMFEQLWIIFSINSGMPSRRKAVSWHSKDAVH